MAQVRLTIAGARVHQTHNENGFSAGRKISMSSVFTHLRGMRRLLAICLLLFRQFIAVGPSRLLFGPSEKALGKYLSPERPQMSTAEIARETLQKLGPTYVKFGQFLSIRPDLIPPEYCLEFKKLQDKVPPFRFALVRKQLEQEMKTRYTDVFSEFDAI